jgi:phosphatidylinositol glycan class V
MASFMPTSTWPVISIISAFVLFKGFILLIASAAALGPDYDTSTSLFFARSTSGTLPSAASLAHRLTRWDGIYFMAAAYPDGLLYEQQWAFGPAGVPALVSILARLCGRTGHGSTTPLAAELEPFLAIVVSHVSHLVTVLALYHLTLRLSRDVRVALVASLLHIVSPAGLFLSAPYAESPFACLTMLAHLLAINSFDATLKADLSLIGAGVLYGISTLFRSNGLISGLLFAVAAVSAFLSFVTQGRAVDVRRLIAAIIGGVCVAAGSGVPQYYAWQTYCSLGSPRPWCSRLIPSIYTFVQEAYW